ncbi:MAG: c-type cytochrome [Solimonas sp.]
MRFTPIRMTLAAAAALAVSGPTWADGDAGKGKTVFALCAACHVPSGGIGPSLVGTFGKKAGSVPGFNYSKAMVASGLTWDDATLEAFLADPGKTVAGTSMPINVPSPQDRQDVIAYLKTLK